MNATGAVATAASSHLLSELVIAHDWCFAQGRNITLPSTAKPCLIYCHFVRQPCHQRRKPLTRWPLRIGQLRAIERAEPGELERRAVVANPVPVDVSVLVQKQHARPVAVGVALGFVPEFAGHLGIGGL